MYGLALAEELYMTTCRSARFLAAALMLGGFTVSAAAADKKPKLDQALQHAVPQKGTGSLDVIIRVVPGGHDSVRARLAAKGHAVTAEHVSINALSATVDAAGLADLDRNPLVTSISLNAIVHAHQTAASPDALVTLNALRSLVGATATHGPGRGIAVIDSG
jgi:hypothetical protein